MGESFACEVTGLQLWEKPDAQTVQALHDLWSRHGVLVFRRQCLSEHELADFCALFGPLELTVRRDWASSIRPEVGIISNLKDGTGASIGGLADGEIFWHSDQSYMLDPATGAALYAVEIAHEGGSTRWANLAMAYEALPPALRSRIEGRNGVFDYSKRLAGYKGADRKVPEDQKNRTPPVLHPLVHAHPRTGAQSLYLDPTTLVGIEGMESAAANALLDEIIAFATQRRFVYEHAWHVGDLLLWDNGFLMHQRDPFPPTEKRLMKRMTMVLRKDLHMVPEGRLAEAA
jgi:alpha-ketoglutarate-dependent taurine dioxygenase